MATCYLVTNPEYDSDRECDVVFLTYNDAKAYAVELINVDRTPDEQVTVDDDIDCYEMRIKELPLNPVFDGYT